MTANSKIEWTDHTFNPWVGCTKVSPGCDHCYAESWAKRAGHPNLWTGARRRTTPANWAQVMKWDAAAKKAGRVDRVFCASLADVFDNEVPQQWRTDLFQLIQWTSHLQWLLLTKRIGNARAMLPADWGAGYPNALIGATVVNQNEAVRDVLKLLCVPAVGRFLSCEPLLGPIDLSRVELLGGPYAGARINALRGSVQHKVPRIDWVIVGGESGGRARPMHPEWVRQLRDACNGAGIPYFFKQWGEWAPLEVLPDLSGKRLNIQLNGYTAVRAGKKVTGRVLDGRTWDELPKVLP